MDREAGVGVSGGSRGCVSIRLAWAMPNRVMVIYVRAN